MYMARAQNLPSAETDWIEEAPSNEEAIEYVTMKQVERGHWSNEAKEYYYAKRAAALGVREQGPEIEEGVSFIQLLHPRRHADALGVS